MCSEFVPCNLPCWKISESREFDRNTCAEIGKSSYLTNFACAKQFAQSKEQSTFYLLPHINFKVDFLNKTICKFDFFQKDNYLFNTRRIFQKKIECSHTLVEILQSQKFPLKERVELHLAKKLIILK